MKKRLFIAVDISNEAREHAASYIAALRETAADARISWTKRENLHLTLKFLGDVDEAKIAGLVVALDKALTGMPTCDLEVVGTGVFPSARKPKVLWLGVNDIGGNLLRVAGAVDDGLSVVGFPIEEREFSPHLTIGRVRDPRNARDIARKHLQSKFDAVRFKVTEVVLYESTLSPSGSIYNPIFTAKLTA